MKKKPTIGYNDSSENSILRITMNQFDILEFKISTPYGIEHCSISIQMAIKIGLINLDYLYLLMPLKRQV